MITVSAELIFSSNCVLCEHTGAELCCAGLGMLPGTVLAGWTLSSGDGWNDSSKAGCNGRLSFLDERKKKKKTFNVSTSLHFPLFCHIHFLFPFQ